MPTPAAPPAPPTKLPPAGELRPVPEESVARYKKGDTFDQEVVVTLRSQYRTFGIDYGQESQYTITSRLTVEAIGRDGGLTVKQTITAANLIRADAAIQPGMTAALRKSVGAAFEIATGPDGEVTALRGPKDPVRVLPGNNAAGNTLRMWSVLDEDAWREIAGLTFFQPPRPPQPGDKWNRRISHDWGPLGTWSGQTTYAAAGERAGVSRIDYGHALTYRPPQGDAGGDLPFRVLRAEFKPLAAGGVIGYDTRRGRVAAAEEAFRVRGDIVVSVEGTWVTIEMLEEQGFRVRVTEPVAGVMSGKPLTGKPGAAK